MQAEVEAHLKSDEEAKLKTKEESNKQAKLEIESKAEEEAKMISEEEARILAQPNNEDEELKSPSLLADIEAQLKNEEEAAIKQTEIKAQLKAKEEAMLKVVAENERIEDKVVEEDISNGNAPKL